MVWEATDVKKVRMAENHKGVTRLIAARSMAARRANGVAVTFLRASRKTGVVFLSGVLHPAYSKRAAACCNCVR